MEFSGIEILDAAKKVIEIESSTLLDMKNSLNENFIHCVQFISKIRGRVIVSGIGKSAIVGQKIVSTFNSTGTHSIFLHAADAIHGDLGMLKEEDIVICISKSGETSEIRVLLSILRGFGNTVVAMTSNKESYLAKNSDFLLYIPVKIEAEPNNLAPTSSTVAQMAMGDALASVLLMLKGFSPEQFAKYHPGGSLGKQLYLRVSDLYKHNEKPCVKFDTDLKDIIMIMTSMRLGATAVIDDEQKIIGIITDGDLRRMLKTEFDIENVVAGKIMSVNPKIIHENSLAAHALEKMRTYSITQLIVSDENQKFLGFVHIHDILKEGII